MRMLISMIRNTLNDGLKEEKILDKLKIAPIEDKMSEIPLRLAGHLQSRPIDATVKENDSL